MTRIRYLMYFIRCHYEGYIKPPKKFHAWKRQQQQKNRTP